MEMGIWYSVLCDSTCTQFLNHERRGRTGESGGESMLKEAFFRFFFFFFVFFTPGIHPGYASV